MSKRETGGTLTATLDAQGGLMKKNSGKELNRNWRVGAKHALYRKDGKWYHHLLRFPGALFDRRGYIVLKLRRITPILRTYRYAKTYTYPVE